MTRRLKFQTWVIEYADGMVQQVDAFSQRGAEAQATHGSDIVSVVPTEKRDPTRHAEHVQGGAGWLDPIKGYGGGL